MSYDAIESSTNVRLDGLYSAVMTGGGWWDGERGKSDDSNVGN